ncbi:membrane protein [Nostoc cycadae WK-1]|uniref:Membrane protein n=2 Tax=Nostoc cycadae TaxID=246795 RepID=A0A2H6LR56_9NOSO|nr:membrane protein [Nostoc cycadae WK-1]
MIMLLEEDEEQQPNQETIRYLTHIEQKLYTDIETRKRVDAGLLFLACQITSCSLSWLLFQLQVTLSIIQVSSAIVSLLPGLIDVGDGFSFSFTSESWEFTLGQKPLIGIIKLIIGGAVSWNGTGKIAAEVLQTNTGIAETYQEIRSSEGLSYQLPNIGVSLAIALVAVLLIGFLKKGFTKNENQG